MKEMRSTSGPAHYQHSFQSIIRLSTPSSEYLSLSISWWWLLWSWSSPPCKHFSWMHWSCLPLLAFPALDVQPNHYYYDDDDGLHIICQNLELGTPLYVRLCKVSYAYMMMTMVTVMIMVMMLTVLMITMMMMLTCPRSGSLGSGLHTDSWLPKLQI